MQQRSKLIRIVLGMVMGGGAPQLVAALQENPQGGMLFTAMVVAIAVCDAIGRRGPPAP